MRVRELIIRSKAASEERGKGIAGRTGRRGGRERKECGGGQREGGGIREREGGGRATCRKRLRTSLGAAVETWTSRLPASWLPPTMAARQPPPFEGPSKPKSSGLRR